MKRPTEMPDLEMTQQTRPPIKSPLFIPPLSPSHCRRHHENSNLWVNEDQEQGGCLDKLGWKKRLVVKFFIAVITLGCMMGVAFGISAAVAGRRLAWKHKEGRVGI